MPRRPRQCQTGLAFAVTVASASRALYMQAREVGAGERLANPVRSGRKQP